MKVFRAVCNGKTSWHLTRPDADEALLDCRSTNQWVAEINVVTNRDLLNLLNAVEDSGMWNGNVDAEDLTLKGWLSQGRIGYRRNPCTIYVSKVGTMWQVDLLDHDSYPLLTAQFTGRSGAIAHAGRLKEQHESLPVVIKKGD